MPDAREPEIDLEFLRSCLLEAGQAALEQRAQKQLGQVTAMIKADLTPVTEVDKQVEGLLIERIHRRYPEHSILSEESGQHPQQDTVTWVIDPIDGTRAFAGGLPVWGVSIGVMRAGGPRAGEPLAGGLYLPVTGEMYWGTRQAAFYNDQPLPKITDVDLESPLVFLGVPSNFHLHFDVRYPRVRSMGSTAAHLAYIATGAAVGALTRAVSLWDLAGLLPVLEAVGIELSYLSGRTFKAEELLDGGKIHEPLLAAHPSVMETVRSVIWKKEI